MEASVQAETNMGRHVENGKDIDLKIVEYVVDDDGKVVCLKCGVCNKFIKKDWDHFYCPHCDVSFIEGLSAEDQRCSENLVNYLEDIGRLMDDDNLS